MRKLLGLLKPTNMMALGFVGALGAAAWFGYSSWYHKNRADHAVQAHNYANEERPLMEVVVVDQSRDPESGRMKTSYLLKPYKDDGTFVDEEDWMRVTRAGPGFIVEANREASRYTWGARNPSYVQLDRFLGIAEPSQRLDEQSREYVPNGAEIPTVSGAPPGYVDPAFLSSDRQKRTLIQSFFDSFHDNTTRIEGRVAPQEPRVAPGERYLISSNGTGRIHSEPADDADAIQAVRERQDQIRRALEERPPTPERKAWEWIQDRFEAGKRLIPLSDRRRPGRSTEPLAGGAPEVLGTQGLEATL